MDATPEIIEQFKVAREKMRADPTHINESIAKMSLQAQIYANQFREIARTEPDVIKMTEKIEAIRAPLSADIIKELDQHRKDLVEKYGLPILKR